MCSAACRALRSRSSPRTHRSTGPGTGPAAARSHSWAPRAGLAAGRTHSQAHGAAASRTAGRRAGGTAGPSRAGWAPRCRSVRAEGREAGSEGWAAPSSPAR